jgi:hypothetical protein
MLEARNGDTIEIGDQKLVRVHMPLAEAAGGHQEAVAEADGDVAVGGGEVALLPQPAPNLANLLADSGFAWIIIGTHRIVLGSHGKGGRRRKRGKVEADGEVSSYERAGSRLSSLTSVSFPCLP